MKFIEDAGFAGMPVRIGPAPIVSSFGEYTIDLRRGILTHRRRGMVALRKKCFEALAFFVRNAGCVVTKSMLHDSVWGEICVSDDSLTQVIRGIRKALSDENQTFLRTIVGRGYIFCAEGAEAEFVAS